MLCVLHGLLGLLAPRFLRLDQAATFLTQGVLNGEAVGLEPIEDDRWQLWFGPIYLGLLTKLGRGRHSLTPNRPYAK